MLDRTHDTVRDRLTRIAVSLLDGRLAARPGHISLNLREAGLTSLDMVKFVIRIEDEFGVVFGPDDMDPVHFETLERIEPIVLRLMA